MKKLSILLLSIFTIVAFTSCDSAEMGPVANTTEPGSPELTSPESGQSYTLTEGQKNDTLMTVEWTKPDFGFSSAPTYQVEMAESGTQFTESIELGSVQGATSFPVVVKDLNNTLISEKFAASNSHSLDLRVTASISDSASKAISEPVTLSFTPYLVEISYPEIYVPGNYQTASNQGSDWTPADAPALYSVEDNDQYEGYVNMANGDNQFKFTQNRDWSKDWGTDGSANGLVDSDNEGNIPEPNAGYYKINVNLNDLTFTMKDTDWAVTGDATPNGWAGDGTADHDMTYNPDSQVWSIDLQLSSGAIKFRANDAWDLGYGDANGDGRLDQQANNDISVDEAGNYTIILDLSEAPYSYELQQN